MGEEKCRGPSAEYKVQAQLKAVAMDEMGCNCRNREEADTTSTIHVGR